MKIDLYINDISVYKLRYRRLYIIEISISVEMKIYCCGDMDIKAIWWKQQGIVIINYI